MDLGSKIKELRIEKGMTQKRLAKHLHVSPATLSCYENNRYEPPLYQAKMLRKTGRRIADAILLPAQSNRRAFM